MKIDGRPGVQVAIEDISRGGVGVTHACKDKLGTVVETTLPGGGVVAGRIARSSHGSLGLVFHQDDASLALIDAALAFVRRSTTGRAA